MSAPLPLPPRSAPELRDLEEQTQVGEVLLRALMRRQLRLSVLIIAVLVVLLAAQPLLAWVWPSYADIHVLSIPLPWLVLGVGSYPVLVLLGIIYVRAAETIDSEFGDLLRR